MRAPAKNLRRLVAVAVAAALLAAFAPPPDAQERQSTVAYASSHSVLANNLLVTWYGNPHTGLMGVLGQFTGGDLARRLQRQADAYAHVTDKQVMPAYELIAVVAQD